jgi:putative nucleotidyltransferase with HDIG domain/diguanylate cyclase (GGDEF)-like protein
MVEIKELKKITSNFTVLYVEDDVGIQSSMLRYLQKFFKTVFSASNGEEGLKLFKTNKIDIVITDLSMPVMNGISMIKEINKIHTGQVILITTAHSESEYLLEAIHTHVDGYVIKPFVFEDLNQELYRITQKLQIVQENEEYKEHLQQLLEKQSKKMSENYEKTLYSMVELIEQRDTYTAGHSKRVAYYSELIAQEMGYVKEECKLLHQAGILHDIGKIETPDSVLLNPTKLDDIEYKLIQEHVNVGYKLLSNIPMFEPLSEIVYQHHERYDGSGYPNGLKGNQINPLAQIMIVADAFDAMTTNRIYKGRKSVQEALDELVELSAKQFDPKVVQSAVVALKNVEIDENINQLPQTKLEEERFAYFYNDRLTKAYNQSYLEVVLMKNNYELHFNFMQVFSINKFSAYNKKYGWSEGDELLKQFADSIINNIEDSLVFRVFGDDFVVLSEKAKEFFWVVESLDILMKENSMTYKMKSIDLREHHIENINDIEREFLK